MPGKIPPINVTSAATASATDTATGKRDGADAGAGLEGHATAARSFADRGENKGAMGHVGIVACILDDASGRRAHHK